MMVAWIGNLWAWIVVLPPSRKWMGYVESGRVLYAAETEWHLPPPGWNVQVRPSVTELRLMFGWFSQEDDQTSIPLWPFILAFGIPSIWTLLAARRRRDPNACPHCRYPRGASPICTECGQPLPNPPQPH